MMPSQKQSSGQSSPKIPTQSSDNPSVQTATSTNQPPAKASGKPAKAVTMTQAIARTHAGNDSRKMAAAILEVLAGVRTTTDAAKVLEVSLSRIPIPTRRQLGTVFP